MIIKRVCLNILLLLIIFTFGILGKSKALFLSGSGSSAVYPFMSLWSYKYKKAKISYQPIGSGGGINAIQNGLVDFAASDVPLNIKELNKYNLFQFPFVFSGIVPVINITGLKKDQLKLTGNLLADIFMGKVIYWDNSRIIKLNQSLKKLLKHTLIVVVHRADGSGTTYNFTNYLSRVSKGWSKSIGFGTVVPWRVQGIGAKGNQGVTVQVKQTLNSIGYVDLSYAKPMNLVTIQMINRAGNLVSSNLDTIMSATKSISHRELNHPFNNSKGKQAWPITMASYALISNKNINKQDVWDFFLWGFQKGQKDLISLLYAPLAPNIINSLKIMAQKKLTN